MNPSYMVALTDIDPAQMNLVGRKAANLAALHGADFPVPDGLCLTTAAFDLALREARNVSVAGGDHRLDVTVPERILSILNQALPTIVNEPRSPLAVRSSSTLEDGRERSFAGAFKTTLGVRGQDALIEAIKDCWRSFFRFQLEHYGTAVNDTGHGMAVLIQPMIDAECAGVCFSVDPVEGSREQMVVSAAWGLGAGVVDGTVASDSYWIDRDRLRPVERQISEQRKQVSLKANGGVEMTAVAVECRRSACLPDAWLRRIAQFAIAAEGLFGRAQEIEWAIAGNKLWLLQSRPITNLPDRVSKIAPFSVNWAEDQDRLRAWERYPLAGHEKDVLLPLERDCLAAIEATREDTCRFIGADRNGRLAFFNGRPYFCSLPINMSLADMRVRRQAMDDLARRLREQNLTAWDYWGPEIVRAVDRLRSADLSAADGPEMADHLEEALAVRRRHFMLHPIMWFKPEKPYFEAFAALTGQSIEESEAAAYRLLEGEENILTRLIDSLYDLATIAGKSPTITALLSAPGPKTIEHLQNVTGADRPLAEAFLAGFDALLDLYGARNGNGYGSVATVCTPTWAEDPTLVLGLVAAYLDPGSESPKQARARARREREAQIEALCQAGDERAAAEFRRQLAYARKAFAVLEEHNHYLDQTSVGQLRAAILAGGDYLATDGALDSRDDVFWLFWDELVEVLRSEQSEPRDERIGARKAQHESWQTMDPPPFLGLPSPTLPDRPSPGDDVTPSPETAQDMVRGIGASPGRTQGRARVVRDRLSMPKIVQGDILVAPNAGPLWTPLFPLLGGLVLDGGSLGQHAAVTAREYGLPAVIATRTATGRISDGAWVSLDGTAGTVEILSQG